MQYDLYLLPSALPLHCVHQLPFLESVHYEPLLEVHPLQVLFLELI